MITIKPEELYTLLSDETRLRCLMLLYIRKELCVCDLHGALASSQPKISRHLSLLRQSSIVTDERRGQWVYYRLNPNLPNWISAILSASFENLQRLEPYLSDQKRIKILKTKC